MTGAQAGATRAPRAVRAGRDALLLALFAAADLAALTAAFCAAFALRKFILPDWFAAFGRPLQPFDWTLVHYLRFWPVALLWHAAFAAEGLYGTRRVFWEETRHLLRAASLAFIAILLAAFIFSVKEELSRPLVVMTFAGAALTAIVLRRGLRRLLRGSALYARRLLLVAAPPEAEKIRALLAREASLGYEIAGAQGTAPLPGIEFFALETPAHEAMRACGATDLLVATAGLDAGRLAQIIEESAAQARSVRIVPDLAGLPLAALEPENLGDLPFLHIPQNLTSPVNLVLKRGFDLAVALFLLPFIGPLLFVLWLWVKFDSKGEALLKQERLARGGGTFGCYKFRTMHADADGLLESRLRADPEAAKEWATYQKLKDDPRVTRAGRWLRKLSLDELPQLFNILKGEMSLAGPRPYLPREIETMGRHAPIILRARPGITGLWQVSGRNALPFARRLQLDEYYVRNWSLWLDLTLLLRTPKALLMGHAY